MSQFAHLSTESVSLTNPQNFVIYIGCVKTNNLLNIGLHDIQVLVIGAIFDIVLNLGTRSHTNQSLSATTSIHV